MHLLQKQTTTFNQNSKTSMNQLTLLSWLTLTLASINSWTTVVCPSRHANIRGVSPLPHCDGDKQSRTNVITCYSNRDKS